MDQRQFERELGRPLMSRERFVAEVRSAVREGRPYATGKTGGSEQAILYYPIVLEREPDPHRRRAFELSLGIRGVRHAGLFPATPRFHREYSAFYADRLPDLDCLGLFPNAYAIELELLRHHHFGGTLVRYVDQEPDRSIPADDGNCYLSSFRDKDVLLICPFAQVLRERATPATFEAVWANTGKGWFGPRTVDAIEFPYGFEPATQERYANALELLAEIENEIERREFDVALIAAGGLGIPIAAFVKRQGKVGISLGGHLQVLFGVFGERWLSRENWRRNYMNDAWIRVPERYRPDMSLTGEDYW